MFIGTRMTPDGPPVCLSAGCPSVTSCCVYSSLPRWWNEIWMQVLSQRVVATSFSSTGVLLLWSHHHLHLPLLWDVCEETKGQMLFIVWFVKLILCASEMKIIHDRDVGKRNKRPGTWWDCCGDLYRNVFKCGISTQINGNFHRVMNKNVYSYILYVYDMWKHLHPWNLWNVIRWDAYSQCRSLGLNDVLFLL